MNGITFDAGGLIALDRNHRGVIVLLARLVGVPCVLVFLKKCDAVDDK